MLCSRRFFCLWKQCDHHLLLLDFLLFLGCQQYLGSLLQSNFSRVALDHLSELSDVVTDRVVQPTNLHFEPGVLLQDVVDGHETEEIFSASCGSSTECQSQTSSAPAEESLPY